jgi:6-phosphogluconolactonase (cycloisomerase 2 family)
MLRRSLLGAVVALFAIAAPAVAADDPGAVYALSNSASGNAVLVYDRAADGSLSHAGTYATGGLGLGAGLGSQGAVTVSGNGRVLLGVNAGSNSVSTFAVESDGLELRDVEGSGGIRPTSVAERNGFVYVLNAGVPSSIAGFRLDATGELTPIAGSVRPLAADQTTPSQIAIAPSGDALVVTERATNSIMTWSLGKDGVPGTSHVFASGGAGPFGFAFGHRNTFVVSDAAGTSGASSYRLDGATVETISPLVPSMRTAACWTAVTKDGRFAYVTNGGTGDVTGLAIDQDGSISLLDPSGVTASVGGAAVDAALSNGSRYLYVRNGALGKVDAFRIAGDGSLSLVGSVNGLPATAAGLAAR